MPSQKEIKDQLQARADAVADKGQAAGTVAVVEQEQRSSLTINEQMSKPAVQEQLARALPNKMDADRFTRIVLTAVHGNPRLQQCTFKSLVSACLQSAQLGLEPNTPLHQAALIPYWDRDAGEWIVNFQLMYRGLIALAHRCPKVLSISAQTVYELDEYKVLRGTDNQLYHRPNLEADDPGPAIFYYAVVHYAGGGHDFQVLTRKQIEYHRAFSKMPGGPAWRNSYDAMATKTCLIELSKYIPQAVELSAGIAADDSTPVDWEPDLAERAAAAPATIVEPQPAAEDVCEVCGCANGEHAEGCPEAGDAPQEDAADDEKPPAT